jgi:hypothetical protein
MFAVIGVDNRAKDEGSRFLWFRWSRMSVCHLNGQATAAAEGLSVLVAAT